MAVGIQYTLPQTPEKELYNVRTGFVLSGGFNLSEADIENGVVIHALTPISVDFKKRTAKISKSVKAVENISGTTLKIQKGSFVKVGNHLGTGSAGATISAIDKTNALYDVLTLSKTIDGVKTGDILFEATAEGGQKVKNPANFLNYATFRKETGSTLSALGQAYEIKTDELYAPISEKDQQTLGARFLFI